MRNQTVGAVVCLTLTVFAVGVSAQMPTPARVDPDRSLPDVGGKALPQPIGSAPTASVLQLIKFSGNVADAQGVVGVTFALYADQEGGSPLWLETQNVQLDDQGHYTVLLGATSSEGLPLDIFSSGNARWLGIQPQGQSEQQRILLVAVPYALKAVEADRLAGRAASDYLLAEQLESQVKQTVETQVSDQLQTKSLSGGGDGTLAQVTGNGTAGQLPVFTSTGVDPTVGDSIMTQSGSNIGINTTNPAVLLEMNSGGADLSPAMAFSTPNQQDFVSIFGGRLTNQNPFIAWRRGPLRFATEDSFLGLNFKELMRITPTGRVGINTTNPQVILEVNSGGADLSPAMAFTTPNEQDFVSIFGGRLTNQNPFIAWRRGPLRFATADSLLGLNFSEKMRLTSSGNLGIGTTNPTQRLDVNGTVKATAFMGDGAGLTNLDAMTLTGFITSSGFVVQETASTPNIIGGFGGNTVSGGIVGATISGGGDPSSVCGPGGTDLCRNSVSGNYGSVGGGVFNSASGNAATVGGGSSNVASGLVSTVGGGIGNAASNNSATVGGGDTNTASALWSTTGGGNLNNASGVGATVGGGVENAASGSGSTLGGGSENTASGSHSTVGGGALNTASAGNATIGGGTGNTASGELNNTVGGGQDNTASGGNATVGGGIGNTASGINATVAGGNSGSASGISAFVGGGRSNVAGADFATISGGGPTDKLNPALANRVTDEFGTIGGGGNNQSGDNAGTTDDAAFATVAGGEGNTASGSHSTVGGGIGNTASGLDSTVSGGSVNSASANFDTVGGGFDNVASGGGATVSGGAFNSASGEGASVAGGQSNSAGGLNATVGGGGSGVAGQGNDASGDWAIIPGGLSNLAQGDYSFAAGRRAKAVHDGAFVWADSTDLDIFSGQANAFVARASGGVRFFTSSDLTTGVAVAAGGGSWSSVSDRNLKENVEPVDSTELLAALSQIPVATWNYKAQDPSIRHLGPMAQDFYAAFGLGEDDKHITTIDGQGVALAAIQALYRLRQQDEAELAHLRSELAETRALLEEMRAALKSQGKTEVAALETTR